MYLNHPDAFLLNSTRAPQEGTYVRFFNASPNAPALDIYMNGILVVKNLAYKQLTQYMPLPAGNYTVKVFAAGETTNQLISEDIYLPSNIIFNLAITGNYPDISLYPIPEPVTAENFGRPCIRFINLVPNSVEYDVYASNLGKIFNKVGYKYITNYACVPAGTYSFSLTPNGSSNQISSINNVTLNPNNYYTIYALGLSNSEFPLQLVVVPEPR